MENNSVLRRVRVVVGAGDRVRELSLLFKFRS